MTYWDWRTEDVFVPFGDGNLADWMSRLDPTEVLCVSVGGVEIWSEALRPAIGDQP